MTAFTEGNLRIAFPRGARVRKFDDPESHGLSCMKAVDYIVEEDDRVSFIELKDPEHPRAKEGNREEFIRRFQAGKLDEDLKYKYRDTFLYEWASGGLDKPIFYCKPIFYWIVVAIETLSSADLSIRTDNLKRKLPLNGSPSGKWKRQIVTDCEVFNIETWNKHQPRFPLTRIS